MVESSRSINSSINVWLDHHPNQPEDYVFERSKTFIRKQKRHLPDRNLSTRSSKRQQLMDISGNKAKPLVQSPERKVRPTRQGQPPATSTRSQRSKKTAQRPSTINPGPPELNCLEEEDPEEMPTPRPNPLGRIPSLQAPSDDPQYEAPPSRGESSDSGDPQKSRSRSPSKRLEELQFSHMPVDPRTWSSGKIPVELKELVRDMQAIGKGAGVIPLAVKDKFAAIEEDVLDFQWAQEGGKAHGGKEEKPEPHKRTRGLGHAQFWDRVMTIHQATTECMDRGYPEPAWNSEVHSRVLRLALEGYWGEKEVWYMDITVARISNKSLVPWNIATGAMQSKLVDYAMVIDPSRDFTGDPSRSLHNHIIEKLRSENTGASINQTAAGWVRFKPIAVNIETKKGAVAEDEAHVQLGTWLTAQYSRLRQLMPDKAITKLPSFPVLSVQGQRWLLMIASLQDNDRINLIKELYLGDTDSIAGVYQVIAAIRRIARWINDVYRPWFEREILSIKVGVLTRS